MQISTPLQSLPQVTKLKRNDWFAICLMLVPSLSRQIIYRFSQEVFFLKTHILTKQAVSGCDQEAYDPFCAQNDHPGEYVELQNGPAASQRHSFPLDARSSYEWTEYLAAFSGDVKKLQDKDYDVANAEVLAPHLCLYLRA
eukprot:COSAG06_NODE_4333_length_4359_cov_33.125393_4_plen_141_part_00